MTLDDDVFVSNIRPVFQNAFALCFCFLATTLTSIAILLPALAHNHTHSHTLSTAESLTDNHLKIPELKIHYDQ